MIVLDASAVIEALLGSEAGRVIGERIFAPETTLHAPDLLYLEVLQALRRYESAGEMIAERSAQAVEDLAALDLEIYPHRILLGRIWELRKNLTAYDAAYVALAELLEVRLLTRDGLLARAPHRAAVELVGEG